MWSGHYVSSVMLMSVWTSVGKNNLQLSCPRYDWQLKTNFDRNRIGDWNISILNPIVIKKLLITKKFQLSIVRQSKFDCQSYGDGIFSIVICVVTKNFRSPILRQPKVFCQHTNGNQKILSLIKWWLKKKLVTICMVTKSSLWISVIRLIMNWSPPLIWG
jgi:hypothetical protein